MANTRQELGKAFELIKQDRLEDAITLVKPITEAEPENADAWWLLANASSEPRDARRALVTVLKINSAYPKARDLLEKLNELYPPRDDELMMMMEIEDVEPPPHAPTPTASSTSSDDGFMSFQDDGSSSDIDDLFAEPAKAGKKADFDDLDDFGDDEDPFAELLEEGASRRKKGGGRRFLRVLLFLIILVGIAGAAFVFLGKGSEEEEATPVAQAGDPADLVEVTAEQVNAENATILEEVRQTLEADAKTDLSPEARAIFVQFDSGAAIVIKICTEPDPALPNVATRGMRLVANRVGNTPAIQGNLTKVGISLEDCVHGNDTLYRATSTMDSVMALLSNTADPESAFGAFQQTWTIES